MFLFKFLSLERIEAYRQVSSEKDEMLFARYLWNIALCEACYPLLSLFEIALRNAVDHALKQTHGEGWLSETSSLLKIVEQADIIKHKQRLGSLRASNRNQLIGSLMLGFWVGLFRKEYGPLWHPHLKEVFPHLVARNRNPQFIFNRLTQIRPIP